MGVQERKARQKESLRHEILEAARDLFADEGYQNVSMRRIAEKIEYSPTTIYLYFRDKSELLDQICEETFARLVTQCDELKERIGPRDPLALLLGGLRNYVQFGLDHPNHYKVTFLMDRGADAEKLQRKMDMGLRAFEQLRESVVECVRLGIFKNTDPDTASQALWAAAHGVTSLLIVHCDFPFIEREKLIDQTLGRMVAGFCV